jgi:hypothetical protein
MKGEDTVALSKATFAGTHTPKITSISPRLGTVEGGVTVTFTGTGFTTTVADHSVKIDGLNCPVSTATATAITCVTAKRVYPEGVSPEFSLVLTVKDKGLVAKQGNAFDYVQLWSADSTWSGEFAPMDGESVGVPKGLKLLVDVKTTPVFKFVLVEGVLIFEPHPTDATHHRTFDAHYIFVKGGRMQVGTEANRYTSKITITMHSAAADPYIPIYGNKCIGLRFGTLDMHGVVRDPVWTVLEETAAAGSSTIKLSRAVDWKAGEEIAIASTSYNPREGE